ncbi:zf-HC2 domain-containing protein [Streptosporangium sp. NPDC051022]|uniref:anti-sigma factor family protein n=1 Tax=Streptosporangium sp. NPDC051022 TaxID=3155752 RepID=UPI0034140EFD
MRRTAFPRGRPADCREVPGLVTGYLDGALPAGWRRRLERHLAGCAACSGHLEQIRVTIEVLGCFGAGDIPDDVLSRLCRAFSGSGASPVPRSGAPPGVDSGTAPVLDPGVPPVPEGGH